MILDYWRMRARFTPGSRAWFRAWAKRALTFPSVWGAGRRVARLRRAGARVGSGVFVSPADIGGTLSQLQIGSESFIGRAQIQVVAPVFIGARVCINDGVRIFSASHRVDDPAWGQVARPVVIEDYCWVASGAILLPGVNLGLGAVVGAGAVVSRDVPAYAVVVGNPALVLPARRARELLYSPVSHLAGWRAWCGGEEGPL